MEAGEKITVGLVEEVILLPWGVKLPARIDTGAAVSSLDARDIVIKGNTVDFRLPEKYGGLQISLPVVARPPRPGYPAGQSAWSPAAP